jgi:short-subunit dehydrogenase
MATALITGGTSGIGADFARSLAARGYDLVLVARDESRLAAMAAELSSVSVELLPADLSDRADVARVAARIEDPARPIDMLVNNAGFGVHVSLLAKDVSKFDEAFEVMVRAVLVLGGAAARAMRARGTGTIINLSSVAGFITMGGYSAIKGWVASYTQGLSNELRGTGVTTTALCPGWVRTEFHERASIRTSSIPGFLWQNSHDLVEACLRDAAKGKVISIPSLRYKTLMWFAQHGPRVGVRRVSAAISSGRSEGTETEAAHPATDTATGSSTH